MNFLTKTKRIYFFYMTLGLLSPAILGVYYFYGMACGNAVRGETAIAGISAVLGFLSIMENKRGGKLVAHWAAFLFPVPVIFFTPVNMIIKWGLEGFLEMRLVACVTIVGLAAAQIAIGARALFLNRDVQ
ncbi:MAG: hypothetical protein MUD12_16175 [Spirochaetes bacterium]|jgi:hypothetical protein|nr:hypothetical protein [Spirochaetota bacterium]